MKNNDDALKNILQVLKDFDVGQVKLKMGDIELEATFNKALDKVVQATAPKQWKPPAFGIPGASPESQYHAGVLSVADAADLAIIGPALGLTPPKTNKVKHKDS